MARRNGRWPTASNVQESIAQPKNVIDIAAETPPHAGGSRSDSVPMTTGPSPAPSRPIVDVWTAVSWPRISLRASRLMTPSAPTDGQLVNTAESAKQARLSSPVGISGATPPAMRLPAEPARQRVQSLSMCPRRASRSTLSCAAMGQSRPC